MMGEYEKKERYDDIDSVYHTYLIKKMLENNDGVDKSSLVNGITSNSSRVNPVNCDIYLNTDYLDYCQNLFYNTGVHSLIVTSYQVSTLKSNLPSNANKEFLEYIHSLPDYKNTNGYQYRIIVQYRHVINSEDINNNYNIYSYSTIGVDL